MFKKLTALTLIILTLQGCSISLGGGGTDCVETITRDSITGAVTHRSIVCD